MNKLFKGCLGVSTLLLFFFFLEIGAGFAQTVTVSAVAGSPFCAGATFNLNYTKTGVYTGGNVFTAELSTSTGTFPGTAVGNVTSTANGSILVTIPTATIASALYQIRITSSTPITTSTNSPTITINSPPTIAAPTFAPTVFCQGDVFTITYTVTCTYNTLPSTNVFTAQLSDPTGSFASVTSLGTTTSTGGGTITATIPPGTAAGTAYRIRVASSNPSGIVSPNNGTDLTINTANGTAGTAGNGFWYVSCYNGNNFTTYYGFYTETVLNFNTQSRWNNALSPSSASNVTGLAYSGCPIPVDNHSYSYKRTNFTCGYYQIDIPSHDDDVYLLINGVQQFVHNGCCDSHTNVWTGFLGTTSIVELREREGGGQSYLSVNIAASPTNPLITSTPPTVCSGTSTILTVSSALTLNYAWALVSGPGTAPSPSTGASTTVSATGNAVYSVTGTDATTTCTVFKNISVTVGTVPTTTINPAAATLCPTTPSVTLTASGANTYTWSPATGLNTTTGSVVIANPAVTTTYSVVGDIGGCSSTVPASVTVTVPTYPATSTFPSGVWNAYVFNTTTFANYVGFYTENNISATNFGINTTSQWAVGSGPSVTTNSAFGTAYQGCAIGNSGYSISFKRTGFTCGAANANYFQIDIPSHDDDITLLINGIQVYQFIGAGGGHTNVWTGFLGAASTVEFKLANTAGTTSSLQATISASATGAVTANSPITVCSGTLAHLQANSSIAGATYAWTPTTNLTAPNSNVTNAGPMTVNQTYTVTLTDAANTNCTASVSVPITVGPTNVIITPAGPITLTCPGQSVTLTASGANNYNPWSPAAGLNTTAGFTVIATPSVTTTYTVSGDNNCTTTSASVLITNPFPLTTVFPSGTWNVYGFNTQTFTGYQGYYTENGSGTTGYDFNTTTRWASGAAPSTANATNGTAWQGCTMPATNISLSFKRTNFVCGLYTLDVLTHDDDFLLFINGIQVAAHSPGCCDAHPAIWTGELSPASTVEWKLMQGNGGSNLQVRFTRAAAIATQSIWTGGTSNDWFTSTNWCSSIPTSTIDALIPAAGPNNMPVIAGPGAVAKDIIINGAVAAGTYNSAIAAAILTTSGANGLSVFGNWTNNGTYTAGTGTVTFSGAAATTISSAATQVFYNLILNKTNTTTNTSTLQISNSGTFTSGILTQSGSLEFLNGSTTSGASSASFVNGPVIKTGSAAFVFPIGNNTLYAPLTIGATGGVDQFVAQYFYTNPNGSFSVASKDVSLNHVSVVEYWNLFRNSGATNVTVNLTWGANSGVTAPLTDLRVAGWDGTAWRDNGNGGTSGVSSSGSITSSAAVSIYGPFTLASITANNPLPIELTGFEAKYNSGVVLIKWTTESEMNNDFFTIQRTLNAESFEDIFKLAGAGTTSNPQSYSAIDNLPLPGQSYYRLKQTDFNKSVTYSKLVSVSVPESVGRKAYPNPSNGFEFNISFTQNDFNKAGAIKLHDIEGKELFQMSIDSINSTAVKIEVPQKLPSGIYIISIAVGQEVVKQKLVVW